MTDAIRLALVVGTALLAFAGVLRFAVIEHRLAWERTRNRIAADAAHTAAVRAATARERLLREVRVALCEQQAWRSLRAAETATLSLPKAKAA